MRLKYTPLGFDFILRQYACFLYNGRWLFRLHDDQRLRKQPTCQPYGETHCKSPISNCYQKSCTHD